MKVPRAQQTDPHSIGMLLAAMVMLFGVTAAARSDEKLDPKKVEFFEQKIRPILIEHCYECHGAEEQEGGLRLDSRAGWKSGGDSGSALVPGKPDKSLLLKAVQYQDPDLQMPPDGKLPEQVMADFSKWIASGAIDPRNQTGSVTPKVVMDWKAGRSHWCYKLPIQPEIPTDGDSDCVDGPVDALVLARLKEHHLQPAPNANDEVLIRRLYYDLIGLPPSPEEIAYFLNDRRPGAYERLVDRLLASPRFGERWGRHWLDVARYAESLTLRGFILPNAWRYRDYVIESFNGDHRFDAFVRDQISGDLLSQTNPRQKQNSAIATTFLMLGNINLEEQDKSQLDMEVIDEQLEAIGRAFLAQTIGCARCHDHKFDPIPTRDYYALAGILSNVKSLEHANVSKWLDLPLPLAPEEEAALKVHETAVANLAKKVKSQKQKLAKLKRANGITGIVSVDRFSGIVLDDSKSKRVGNWQASQSNKEYVGDGYIHDQNSEKGAKTVTFQPEIPVAGKYEVRLAYTSGTNRATNVPVAIFSAEGEFAVKVNQRVAPPVDGHFVSLGAYRFETNGQGFVLISNEATDGHVIVDAIQFVRQGQAKSTPKNPKKSSPKAQAAAQKQLTSLESELKKLKASVVPRPAAMGVKEKGKIETMKVHIRGSVHNLGEPVSRGYLRVATYDQPTPMPSNESGRKELAQWITHEKNPLTARVYVNRTWHWLFGHGLVRTTDNFGTTGESPSHPQLLDYLALEFKKHDWSTKWLVRELVTSHTYRQSVHAEPQAIAADPENRWFGRASRRRLDAECIRDAMLVAAGRLDLKMHGPTIRAGTNADYGYRHDMTRRSVYVPVLRNALPDLFAAFDFADPSVVTGRRSLSTVAPQALLFLNHPFVRQQATATAERLLVEVAEDSERLKLAYLWTVNRIPSPEEVAVGLRFLKSDSEDPMRELQSWTDVVHALFGSIDFRYVD